MTPKTLLVVLGTRPEAIKLAPLVLAARRYQGLSVVVCNTGQHRELSEQVLELFGVTADFNLDLMAQDQTLADVTVGILTRFPAVLVGVKPDWVIVQGDTTTTFAAALAAFYEKVPVAHIEAGLRTGNIYAPWPEEVNRRLVSEIATLHFPPTPTAAENLVRQGIAPGSMLVTGNTGIDALKFLQAQLDREPALRARARAAQSALGVPDATPSGRGRPYVLVTGHRRENFGAGFKAICAAIAELADSFPEYDFIYPVHPNPRVRQTVLEELGASHHSNVFLVRPLDYLSFVDLMSRATLILTDSGGIQEEAPSLGRRVVVLRDVSERNEGLETGLVRLAGADRAKIVSYASEALTGRWSAILGACDVYGDGHASDRILEKIALISSGAHGH